uniref:Uncharacterized protein n=2 Tax=Riboviria TaxID=2559587 RepID=A0A6M9EIE1_9VIRU|nr:hypothetical protein [Conidiobolus non-segmented RNA virus 1]
MPMQSHQFTDLKDDDLVSSFNADHGKSLSIEVIRKLIGTRHYSGWYNKWKKARAEAKSLPEQWAEAGLKPEEWVAAQAQQQRRKQRRAEFAAASATLAEKFRADLRALERTLEQDLRSYESPIDRVLEVGYDDLTSDAIIRIEQKRDTEREEQLTTEIAQVRKEFVKLLHEGKEIPARAPLGEGGI